MNLFLMILFGVTFGFITIGAIVFVLMRYINVMVLIVPILLDLLWIKLFILKRENVKKSMG